MVASRRNSLLALSGLVGLVPIPYGGKAWQTHVARNRIPSAEGLSPRYPHPWRWSRALFSGARTFCSACRTRWEVLMVLKPIAMLLGLSVLAAGTVSVLAA